ncbi:PEP-CTERM sorting domain-containing protein, partial [Cephaloticoccus primus]|uniref:PEP-CTERM sorting domain-containing protein n=1 Tax=Cephaloticoccus primus TaxID=1548207 RepID=UPI0012E9862D
RNHFDRSWLPNIVFEGYQNYETTWKPYDNNYIQITPFGIVPEPTTYGAILGAVGIGLYLFRRKRKTGRRTSECAAK